MKSIAILGPTASGKTALAIELALRYPSCILSLDSLSLYKEIDIASAKPTLDERNGIEHFGMDVIYPYEHFDVTMFFELYHHAFAYAKTHKKHLIIVGGTGFYLKAMMEGLSIRPQISADIHYEVTQKLINLESAYHEILMHDRAYANKIASNDRYRIQKWFELFLATKQIPTHFLSHTKQPPILGNIPLFEIDTPKELLEKRVILRTHQMLKNGLIEEVFGLEKRYTRTPQCMKAIGIKEVLDYFDGFHSFGSLEEKIAINTLHLAKRQRTFNASQFPPHPKMPTDALFPLLANALEEF